jgi:hypothetical protein
MAKGFINNGNGSFLLPSGCVCVCDCESKCATCGESSDGSPHYRYDEDQYKILCGADNASLKILDKEAKKLSKETKIDYRAAMDRLIKDTPHTECLIIHKSSCPKYIAHKCVRLVPDPVAPTGHQYYTADKSFNAEKEA